jgi:pSer/pThr/pTyr-binding forkhead associated (FHA) protein
MADPRLNSVHLEFPRRDNFRNAREALLNSRGMHTVALENAGNVIAELAGHTMIQDPGERVPPDVNFWLVDQQAIYPLKVGVNTIGRLPDNDVVVQAPYVSRRHCAILVHAGDGCELHDIASKNGTFINGQRLTGPTRLRSGDEIRMCDLRLTFLSKTADGGVGPAHDVTRTE